MNSWVTSESTSSANTSCAMTKSFSDDLQSNTLNIKDANPKEILPNMHNRIRPRRRIGNYHISGTIQKPSNKINSNRSINREEQRRELTTSEPDESTSSANMSKENRATMSYSDALQSNVLYTGKSTLIWQDASNPVNEISETRVTEPDESEKTRRKRSNGLNSKPLINRKRKMQQVTVSVANESTSSANTSCAMTKSFSDALQSNTLNIKDANPKEILPNMHNRIRPRRRIGNYHISGTIQKHSKKINSNRSINREEQRREISTSIHERSGSNDAALSSFNVPKYDSDEDPEPKKRIPKSKKTWMESKVFANETEAKAFIKQESTWSIYTTNILSNGKKIIYRCTNAKLRGRQCDASVYLLYLSKKEEVILYTTTEQHTCQPNRNKKMSEQKKAIIEKLFMDGFKTRKAIQCKLAAANIELPTNNQLNNFISELNVKLFGRSKISIGELEIFLQLHSTVPEDPNEAFIVDYLCDDTNDGDFKFFVSTKTLLRNAVDIEIVSADTAYKMVWQGFPISPIGTTDIDRHFHLFGTLVSKDEKSADFSFAFNTVKDAVRNLFHHEMRPKILISDAAEAIHNGARSAFGMEIIILMCWFHAKKAVKKNISRLVKDARVQGEILSDMSQLNLSRNKDMFEKASAMFLAKYSNFKAFCVYFKTEWLEKNPNWYEGAYLLAPGVKYAPSTNNACESWNRNIKDEKSERNRYPINVFINKILQWTVEWSEEYKSGAKKIITVPTIDLPLWTLAYKWVKMNKPIKRNVDKNGLLSYKFAADGISTIKDWNILTKWKTFKEFKERFCLGWQTYIQDEKNWINGSCSCPSFMKKYICKHLVGLAIRLKFVKPPVEAKALPLNQKRKRGRPSKARKALLVQ